MRRWCSEPKHLTRSVTHFCFLVPCRPTSPAAQEEEEERLVIMSWSTPLRGDKANPAPKRTHMDGMDAILSLCEPCMAPPKEPEPPHTAAPTGTTARPIALWQAQATQTLPSPTSSGGACVLSVCWKP